ncbi:deoxyribonuclease IV [Sporolactobacillus spathodeae]|uniref:Probable endonuclease 4 n=1 Tax=Sporolactobacillus spathodeae TaxID=1465502 RepID=A0ABS2Q6B9_9BACL|nr:deoxyribonuclease IV [Sporolactobacillus spathodeae]MBM7657322.1 deoxyribonuclease-4 [Sporolactobacillus spathodeae]
MLKIGSHVHMSGAKMLLGAAEEAVSYESSVMMIYTGAPQNTVRKPIDKLNIDAGKAYMDAHQIEEVVVHAPYIINLANTVKPETFALAVDFLRKEMDRAQAIGARQIVLHPGSHVGAGMDQGLAKIIEGLNEVLDESDTVQIALETMAGKGSECGYQFEQLAAIIDGVKRNDKLSICFDTCHTNDAGYDIVHDFDGVMDNFDHIIGLDRLKVLHINDSKNAQGARKDRHANIGCGTIGFDALNAIVHYPSFETVPKILETPYVGEDKKNKKPPYKFEIAMFREQTDNPNLLEDIMHQS